MFGRLVLAKSEAILGKPTSEFVLKSTLQAGGYVRSQFFVVVGVAKMFLEGSPNVVRSLQDDGGKPSPQNAAVKLLHPEKAAMEQ